MYSTLLVESTVDRVRVRGEINCHRAKLNRSEIASDFTLNHFDG